MNSLYVDSTSGLTIGLLNSSYEWMDYKEFDHQKPSEVIHIEILNLLKKYSISLKECRFIVNSGPGSYTGMRLGEGLAQVFEWDHFPVYSFHHFDVPKMMGITEGFWVTSAFKGQVFLYEWNVSKNENVQTLIDNPLFKIKNSKIGFTLSNTEEIFQELQSTKNLIKDNQEIIFKHIVENKMRVSPFYFRTVDEEFK
jgi:tRNA threonylcarbamoyladenosine biosynthesis protein TsaB